MVDFIIHFITVYGPLGIGWPIAWYLLRQNQILQDRVMTAFIADTEAKVELKGTLTEFLVRVAK